MMTIFRHYSRLGKCLRTCIEFSNDISCDWQLVFIDSLIYISATLKKVKRLTAFLTFFVSYVCTIFINQWVLAFANSTVLLLVAEIKQMRWVVNIRDVILCKIWYSSRHVLWLGTLKNLSAKLVFDNFLSFWLRELQWIFIHWSKNYCNNC